EARAPDVVYNSNSGLWACCSTPYAKDCSNPSDTTFQATPLDQLKMVSSSLEPSIRYITVLSTLTLLASGASTLNSAAATDTASVNTQPPSSTSQPDGRDPNLGPGAKVGITAGAVIVGLLILACIVYWVRRSKGGQPVLEGPDQSDLDSRASPPAELDVWPSSSRAMIR
ncbi:hypothetical protein MMC29_007061, partial [Sticta canariensis]|nr:hypothetical protein [Sticta canariensis]